MFPMIAKMSEPTSWGSQRVLHKGASPQGGPDTPPIDPPLCLLYIPQGIISAAKELDYEISHGRYTLIVTATDQCPILSRRLTSTTTVGGTEPQLGGEGSMKPRKLPWGRRVERLSKRNT